MPEDNSDDSSRSDCCPYSWVAIPASCLLAKKHSMHRAADDSMLVGCISGLFQNTFRSMLRKRSLIASAATKWRFRTFCFLQQDY